MRGRIRVNINIAACIKLKNIALFISTYTSNVPHFAATMTFKVAKSTSGKAFFVFDSCEEVIGPVGFFHL